jgi:hypothetical protein
MHHELTKHEKKIARILIDKGTDIEFRIALEQVDKIITEWKKGGMDNRTTYHKMYKKVDEQDSRISNRYDGLTGSRYLITVANIYIDGQIDEADIKDFSEQTKAILNELLQYSKRK